MEKVSLLKTRFYNDKLTNNIVDLLQPLGGLASICKSGDKVLLKPNFVMPKTVDSAALTHPEIILSVARLLKEHGCQVAVGDSPGLGSTESIIKKIGIEEKLKSLQVKTVEFGSRVSFDKFKRTEQFERRLKNLELSGELLEYDRIINLAKLKSHGQMGLSLTTKNLFGCVVGHNKQGWHYAAGRELNVFARLLVEIALTVNADLHILDGIVGMDQNGPCSGRPREFGLLLAGNNSLATDRVVVELINKRPEQFPIFTAAREMGLSGLDINEIEVCGEKIADCMITDFEMPSLININAFFKNEMINRLIEKILKQRLMLDKKQCVNCRKCEEICPAKAITFNGQITIDEQKCIRCCCCQELCPVGALHINDSRMVKILRFLKIM